MRDGTWRAVSALLFAAVPTVCCVTNAGAALTIDTFPLWNGANAIDAMGETNTAVYGQTFVAPASDPILTSMTFRLNDQLNPDFVDFDAVVMAWDGTKATGPVLFTAGPFSTTDNGGAGGFENFTINTGSTVLTPGSQYVAFFSAANRFDGQYGTAVWAYLGTSISNGQDGYTGGNFVFLNCGNDASQYTTVPWENPTFFGGQPSHDLAFTLTFVPEPTTLGALAPLAAFALRRRR
jgi:hypothetical protein